MEGPRHQYAERCPGGDGGVPGIRWTGPRGSAHRRRLLPRPRNQRWGLCALRNFYNHDALEAGFHAILDQHGLKLKDLAQALRVALCGKPVSPPIFDTLLLLGRDEVVARVGKWV